MTQHKNNLNWIKNHKLFKSRMLKGLPCGHDELLPMAISNGRVLQFTDSPQRGQHVLDGDLEAVERVPASHLLVQASDILTSFL